MGLGIGDNEGGMAVITVKKAELLEKLRVNREKHQATFQTAHAGYRKALIALLTQKLADAREGKSVAPRLNLVEPTSCLGDYDRAIMMLEWSTKDETQITEEEFSKYVMDNWAWRVTFDSTTSAYVGG